jgi:2,3-bisphosphoglycerate-independent phosphoglycerate mutase
MEKKIVLVIVDGWGIGRDDESNPIYIVKPPTFEMLAAEYPVTSLQASGIAVGLPWSEVGNSEVGHLTIGAGKVLYQYYPKITMAIQDGNFFENSVLKGAIGHAKKNNGAINFAGLLSKGNVHASLDHLLALITMAKNEGLERINLHLFTDGKDSAPKSLEGFLAQIPHEYLATITGRYYAMDRNENWQLTQSAYLNMTGQAGTVVDDPHAAIETTYAQGNTEEYLLPLRLSPEKYVKDGDSLVFFNYREDSIRQIASAFILKDFDKFPVVQFNDLFIATMTHYDDHFSVPVAFPADAVLEPFGKVISDNGLSQVRIAETYKYAHVTYFFNGLRETPFPGEYRTLIPSLSELHPEEHPEMMATAITDRVIESIESCAFDFILVNYANADAMAHTSNYNAAVEAVHIIDREIARLLKAAEQAGAVVVITSDHGNIEEMINPATGLPESQHDPNPVPIYLVGSEFRGRKFVDSEAYTLQTLGSLADIAPTLLEIMGLPKPSEMTGDSLLDKLI